MHTFNVINISRQMNATSSLRDLCRVLWAGAGQMAVLMDGMVWVVEEIWNDASGLLHILSCRQLFEGPHSSSS